MMGMGTYSEGCGYMDGQPWIHRARVRRDVSCQPYLAAKRVEIGLRSPDLTKIASLRCGTRYAIVSLCGVLFVKYSIRRYGGKGRRAPGGVRDRFGSSPGT